jgi:hypothetical protein
VRRSRSVAIAVALAVTAACSSTQRVATGARKIGTTSGGGASASATGADAQAAAANPAAASGATAASGAAKARAATAVAATDGAAGRLGAPGAIDAGGKHIPTGKGAVGVTDSTVTLGFWTVDAATFAAAAAATGYQYDPTNVNNLDVKAETKALIDYFNAHGGLAGRKIVPVYYQANIQNLVTRSGRQQEAQNACATYTEDNHVFSFETFKGFTEDNILQCAIDHKTVDVDTWFQGAELTNSRAQQAIPYWYATNKLIAESRERTQVDRLAAVGFFTKGAKVGVLTEDVPMSKESAAKGLKPALAAHGVPVAAEAVYPDVIDSPWQTYVLQFKQLGIDHVLFSTSTYEWWTAVLFMRAADNQGYHPRYGLTTDVNPGGDFTSNAPKSQLPGAVAVGWNPQADVGAQLTGAQYDLCMKIEKAAGQPGASAPNTCDYLFFTQDALEHAPEFSVKGFQAGVAALGRTYPAMFVPITDFSNGRVAGVTQVQTTAYDEKCGCFNKYNSPPAPATE